MAHGSWLMAHGSWLMAHGSWLMAHGSWLMAHGISVLILYDVTSFNNIFPIISHVGWHTELLGFA